MIKFNEINWYSKLAAIILFVGVIPALAFYIGLQYEAAKNANEVTFIPVYSIKKDNVGTSTSTFASTSATAFATTSKKDILPTTIGQCEVTSVKVIEERLIGDEGDIPGSGSSITYTNNGYQVSYDQVPGIDNSKIGDPVSLCLIYIPKDCPQGDERGIIYRATNLRTKGVWEAPDAEHSCGGA